MRGLGDHLSIGERIAFYRKRRGYTQEVLAGLVGRSTDWLAKAETGRRKPPRIDMLTELARILRVSLGDLLGKAILVEDDKQQDDVPAVRDALMSPRRLSRLLFGSEAETQLPTPAPVTARVEHAWNDYQGGRLGSVIAALPGLLQSAQELEDRASRRGEDRHDCWAVSARTHHLAATTLAKIGESDMSWLAAEGVGASLVHEHRARGRMAQQLQHPGVETCTGCGRPHLASWAGRQVRVGTRARHARIETLLRLSALGRRREYQGGESVPGAYRSGSHAAGVRASDAVESGPHAKGD